MFYFSRNIIAFGDFWRGPAELLSFEGRTGVSWRELLLFHLSALAFSTLIALSLSELELFGFSFAYVYVACATLFAAKRFGAVRGAAVGFFSALPLSAIHSVSFALAGAASGVMFTVGALYGVGAGAIALAAWSAYTGGGIGLLATLPEYAVGGALMLPFVNKTLKKEIEEEPAAPTENAGEMVAAMTLAYRSRPSNALDSLEEALIGISSAARCYGTGGGVSEAEYRELVLSSAKSFDARGGEVARELCIEKSAVIAARLRSGESLSAPMLGLSDPVSAELCDLISRRAAGLGEERYKRRLSDSAYEDYRLISKLLNDARTREDSERAPDPELGERLSLFLAECGLPGGIVKVFGSRRKHIIAAGEDPSGGIIASPEVRSGTERILGTRLGEAEYFRRGATVLMEAEATRLFSAASASATISGSSGEVSGDLSDSFESGDDYFYSILSDGMGSGELARETSGFVIDFLGHTLGTGGFRDTSLHLLNHIIRRRGEECSATVDLFELDLITGDAVFIKSGAAPSYVKRGSSIFRIKSETAPIGLMQNVDAERMRVEIRDGDYVIMLSDGVSSTPEDAPWLLELLAEPPRSSLKEYAEFILSEAVKRSASGDDMTVVITRIETAERDKSKE